MNRPEHLLAIFLSLLLTAGCGASGEGPHPAVSISAPQSEGIVSVNSGFGFAVTANTSVDGLTANPSPQTAPELSPGKVRRRIIYDTRISMNVDSFDTVSLRISELTAKHGGFIANAASTGSTGDQRSGTWTIRLPVENYRAFLDSAGSLGETVSRTETTREVTAEFYDVEARIRNKQIEEQRLISILEERPGKLEDVLAIEKEISRVRGEVEQLQGRMRVLQDLTAFSTITLEVREVQTFVPSEAPTFGTRVEREWRATLNQLTSTGQSIVLGAIATGPWVLMLGLMALPAIIIVRRKMAKGTRHTTA